MVKPTLKPESEKEKKEDELKDDKLKEWGILPAAVVIDETEKEKDKKDAEAAISEFENLETDVDDASRPFIVKFCACFAVFTILLIVICTIGSFLYFHYGSSEDHKWKGWCSVKYDSDNDDSGERGYHGGRHGDHSSSEEEGHNNHHNGRHPRPTGPPGGRWCDQQSEVDLENKYERVERPQEEESERLTFLHDYNVNITAIRLWKSEVCYVTWIERDILMDPQEFWTNMQDPEYLNQYFSELTLTYRTVLPTIPKPLHEQENGKFGEYLDGPKDYICDGAETYWIERIPDEEIEEFMALVEEIMQELMALAASYDGDDEDDDDEEQGDQFGGMPFPGGEEGFGDDLPELPWDFMPMGRNGDPLPWSAGEHGEPPIPGMAAGRQGEHDGRHHGGHGGRKRRYADEVKDAAATAKKCGLQVVKQVAKNHKIKVDEIVPACIMSEINKRKGAKTSGDVAK